jgi:hypothetical protein
LCTAGFDCSNEKLQSSKEKAMTHKSKTETDKPDLSRRKFGQGATLVGVAAAFATGCIYASDSPQQVQPSGQQASETSSDNKTIASKENGEVEARFQRVLQRYGDRLSPEQKTRIRKIITYNERLLDPIRAHALENGQAPATEFNLYRGANEKLRTPRKEQA